MPDPVMNPSFTVHLALCIHNSHIHRFNQLQIKHIPKKSPENSRKNLSLPHADNYLHRYILPSTLGTPSNLEMILSIQKEVHRLYANTTPVYTMRDLNACRFWYLWGNKGVEGMWWVSWKPSPMDTERRLCWNPSPQPLWELLASSSCKRGNRFGEGALLARGHIPSKVEDPRQGLWKFKEARQNLGGGQRSGQGLGKTLR